MLKKIRFFLHNKITFMLIPTNTDKVLSLHISNLRLILIPVIFLLFFIFGLFFSFYLDEKERVLNYYREEGTYYKDQLNSFSSFIPRINEGQESISDKINNIFQTLRVNTVSDAIMEDGIDIYKEKLSTISDYIKGFRELFSQIPSIFPLASNRFWFTSGFGMRRHPLTGGWQFHTGQDIAAFPGTPIRATSNGVVTSAGWKGGYGITVTIKHDFGYESRYAHLSRINVYPGQYVNRGTIIAYVGNTGVSTGYHLHYEVILNGKFMNPKLFLYLDYFGR